MHWLAIHFPQLPLEVWTRSASSHAAMHAEAGAMPAAVIERQRVCRANGAAGTQGVVPGMSVASARALCDGLVLRERQPAAEQALRAQLAQDALRFTPQVSFAGDDGLLLDITGCLRLFHGLDALLARVTASLHARDITARLALADTPGAAWLFACNGIDTRACFTDDGRIDHAALRRQLAMLPVDCLGLEPRTEESIMRMGLERFGELDALPRQATGRRFGNAFTSWLDRVTGVLPDPRPPVAPETFFVRELNFLDGIEHADGLAFPMQRLLGEFGQFLRHRQLTTQHLVWRLTHVDRTTQEIAINTARPEISPARLLSLTRVRLETTRLPAPVETLRLACRRFAPIDDQQRHTLFPELAADERRDDDIAALLDRLRARLGDAQCRQLVPVDDWRPEGAQRTIVAATHGTVPLLPSLFARRPLWLLREPLRAERQGEHLRWRGTLALLDGPERIDGDWWATPLHRDYFVARHEDGTLYWVFHDLARDSWHVHGVFG